MNGTGVKSYKTMVSSLCSIRLIQTIPVGGDKITIRLDVTILEPLKMQHQYTYVLTLTVRSAIIAITVLESSSFNRAISSVMSARLTLATIK